MTPDLVSLSAPGTETVIIAERMHFGVASAPFDVRTLSEAKGQAFSFTSDAWYQLGSETWVGLRVPLVAGSVRQPAGSYLDESAWGNLELRLARRLTITSELHSTLRLTLGAGLGIPSAEHDPSLMPNRVLQIANALEGNADPELFTPGMLPCSVFAQIDYTSGSFRGLALLKAPLMFRVSQADLPSTQSHSHSFAFAPVLQLEARYAISGHFGVALASQLSVDAVPASEHVQDVPPIQLSFRTSPYFEVGRYSALLVDLQAPIAGPLGGSTFAFGLRATTEF